MTGPLKLADLPPPHPDAVRILPLGGLGEIGMNLLVIESRGALLIVDCGLMFPEAYMFGIDLVLPDVSALEGRTADIRAVLLTHGHEDHIGAVPYLLEALGNPPLYGTPLTLGLLRGKLEEHGLAGRARLHTVEPRRPLDLAPFTVEFFRAAHSIVDGCGLAIRTPAGLIVHTGDFKLDPTPVDGQTTDLGRLAAYGEEGVLLLLADSTNVERPGQTLSERSVGEALEAIVPNSGGMLFVATFSSNIHRIRQICTTAAKAGRKVLVSGRSMLANIAIARDLGCLEVPDSLFIDLRQLRELPREQVLVLTTGSQGEPLSSLSRIAMADHRQLELLPGDTVILSAKFIPGNERAIATLINHLCRRGAEVHYESVSEIHVSGHAAADELKTVHSLVRPQWFVPVHGEYRHLARHAALARSMGMPAERAVVLEDGQPLLLTPNGGRLEARVECGRVFIDGKGVGDIGEIELRDRRHLANHGLILVFLAIDQHSGAVVAGPELVPRGLALEVEGRSLHDEALAQVRAVLAGHSRDAVADWEELRVAVRRALQRFCNRTMDRRPLIIPYIMEL